MGEAMTGDMMSFIMKQDITGILGVVSINESIVICVFLFVFFFFSGVYLPICIYSHVTMTYYLRT